MAPGFFTPSQSVVAPTSAALSSSLPPSTTTVVTFIQPTQWIALTTAFIAPSSCAQNRLTMLSSPGFFLWNNEPVPVPATTVSDCLPPEFLASYTAVDAVFSDGTLVTTASSIVPAMSPLVCPDSWQAVFTAGSYIACCPQGYNLHLPTPAPGLRPAYGGTCFSDFALGQTAAATAYDSLRVTGTVQFVASVTPAQAFAHPIDGFTVRNAAGATSSSTSSSSSSSSVTLSSGIVAAIVILPLAALALGLGALYFFLWRPRQRRQQETSRLQRGPIEKDLDVSVSASRGSSYGQRHDDYVSPVSAKPLSGLQARQLPMGRYYRSDVPERVSRRVELG